MKSLHGWLTPGGAFFPLLGKEEHRTHSAVVRMGPEAAGIFDEAEMATLYEDDLANNINGALMSAGYIRVFNVFEGKYESIVRNWEHIKDLVANNARVWESGKVGVYYISIPTPADMHSEEAIYLPVTAFLALRQPPSPGSKPSSLLQFRRRAVRVRTYRRRR